MVHLPEVSAAARKGRLSTEHLRAVSDCVRRHPALASEHEDQWLRQAETLNAEGFRLAARHWLEAASDLDGSEPRQVPDEVSHLHLSRTFQGWLRIDGCLSPQDADLVETVLDAGVDRALRDAHDGDPSVTGRPASVGRNARSCSFPTRPRS